MLTLEPKRISRERKTIKSMVEIYCESKHSHSEGICPNCKEVLEYCNLRISNCAFGNAKPACSECPIHCFKPEMKKRIKTIMRFAGPKMVFRHPIFSIFHILDKHKRVILN